MFVCDANGTFIVHVLCSFTCLLCVRSLVCVFYVFVHVFVYFMCLFTCLCIFMCLFV